MAIRWVKEHAEEYEIDPGSIGLMVALFVMRPRAKGLAGVLAMLGLLLFLGLGHCE